MPRQSTRRRFWSRKADEAVRAYCESLLDTNKFKPPPPETGFFLKWFIDCDDKDKTLQRHFWHEEGDCQWVECVDPDCPEEYHCIRDD